MDWFGRNWFWIVAVPGVPLCVAAAFQFDSRFTRSLRPKVDAGLDRLAEISVWAWLTKKQVWLHKLFFNSYSIIGGVIGIVVGRLTPIVFGAPTGGAMDFPAQAFLIFLLALLLLIPLLHVLLSIFTQNEARKVQEDRGSIPDALRFRRRVDTFEIVSETEVRVIWDMDLECNPDEPITHISFPIRFEIGPGQTPEGTVRLESLIVERRSVADRTSLDPIQVQVGSNGVRMANTRIRIPVKLGYGAAKCRVRVTVMTENAFPNMFEPAGDWGTTDIPLLTRDLQIVVRAAKAVADRYGIMTVPGEGNGLAVEVKSYFFQNLVTKETDRALCGLRETDPRIAMELEYPKTGYSYTVRFRVYERTGSAPPAVPPAPPPPADTVPNVP